MPVNPYDDRKVSLRRPHGNGDLDIVRASYTRRKANITEALGSLHSKQYGPRSDCSQWSSLAWVHIVYFHKKI